MYKVYRYYANGRKEIIIRSTTLEIAKLHCRSNLTKGVTQKGVNWFYGFTKIK